MPAAANMTINNAAAVAKTFSLLNPSAGLSSNAEWALMEGVVPSVYPRITSQVRVNSQGKSRISQHKVRVPYAITDTTTSTTKAGSAIEFNGTVSVPDDFPTANRADAIAYIANYMAHAITKAVMQDGLPAT